MTEFEIEVVSDCQETVIVTRGELDVSVAPQLRTAMGRIDPSVPVVIVDLTDLRFIDSTGISELLRSRASLMDDGRELWLRGAAGDVAKVLEITGLDSLLALWRSQADRPAP